MFFLCTTNLIPRRGCRARRAGDKGRPSFFGCRIGKLPAIRKTVFQLNPITLARSRSRVHTRLARRRKRIGTRRRSLAPCRVGLCLHRETARTAAAADRKSVVEGKSGSVRVDLGG